MSKIARELRNAYQRKYNLSHKKEREISNKKYWEKKAKELKEDIK